MLVHVCKGLLMMYNCFVGKQRVGKLMLLNQEAIVINKQYLLFKRSTDLVLSILMMLFLLPLFILVSVLIIIDSEGPILFKQTRLGRYSRPFTIYKFRTMSISAPAYVPTSKLTEVDSHVTKVGRILRMTSIDELPQLLNIIKNEMSLIGPRPVIPEETELINLRKQYGADSVLPGVTGLAQVSGRDELKNEVKARLDAEYVSKMNVMLDLKIIGITIVKIIRREHISH